MKKIVSRHGLTSLTMTLLLFIFIALTSSAYSQTPGYLGKKVSFYFTTAFFLSLQPEGYSYYSGSTARKVGINLRHDFAADYVISKSAALGGSLKIITSQLNNSFFYQDFYDVQPGTYPKAFSGDVKLRGAGVSVYVKNFSFHRRGGIAPVGSYTKWELMYGRVKGKSGDLIVPEDFQEGYLYVSNLEELGFQKSKGFVCMLFSFGRQSLFFDRLFVTTGATIGLVPNGIASFSDDSGVETEYLNEVNSRMFGYFLLNFNLGIGLLAF